MQKAQEKREKGTQFFKTWRCETNWNNMRIWQNNIRM